MRDIQAPLYWWSVFIGATAGLATSVVFSFGLIVTLIVLFESGIQLARARWQFDAKRLPESLRHSLIRTVNQAERTSGGLFLPRSILWSPRDYTCGACILGIFRSRLLVSGGLVVLMTRDPARVAAILRHETAHVANRDRLVILYGLTVICIYIPIGLSGVLKGTFPLIGFLEMLAQVAFGLWIVFWRRELYADAAAVNGSTSRENYLDSLSGLTHGRASFTHPSMDKRIDAILCSSPLAKRSWLVIGYGIGMCLSIVFSQAKLAGLDNPPTPIYIASSGAIDWWFLHPASAAGAVFNCALLAVPLLAARYEFKKGTENLRPATLLEIETARRVQPELNAVLHH